MPSGFANYFSATGVGETGMGGYLGEVLLSRHYTLTLRGAAAQAAAKVMPAAAVKQVFNDPEPLSLAQPDVHPLKPYYWVFPEASRTAVEEMLRPTVDVREHGGGEPTTSTWTTRREQEREETRGRGAG